MGRLIVEFAAIRRLSRPDMAFATVLALVAFVVSFLVYRSLQPSIHDWSTYNYWFEGDSAIYSRMITDRGFPQDATSRHPLFSLLTFPIAYLPRKFLGVSPETAVGLYGSLVAATWLAVLFATLRCFGLLRLEALAVSALGCATSAAMFWLPVTESYSLSAVSLLLPITLLAYAQRRGPPHVAWYVAVITLSLSVTTTSGLAGVVVALCSFDWKKALRLIALSIAIVVLLSGVQLLLFPSAKLPLHGSDFYSSYVFHPLSRGVGATLTVLLVGAVVMPEPQDAYGAYLSVQGVSPWGGSHLAAICVVGWVALLATALSRVVRGPTRPVVALGLVLAGELAVYTVFSQESFLYSLNVTTLLVVLSGGAFLSPFRRWLVVPVLVLAGLLAWHNGIEFEKSRQLLIRRYETAALFDARVESLTRPSDVVVNGTAPTLTGPPGSWRVSLSRPIEPEPEYLPRFGRLGWSLKGENWRIATLRELRRRGARFFVSNAPYYLAERDEFVRTMDAEFSLVERTADWVVYDLGRPAREQEGSGRPR